MKVRKIVAGLAAVSMLAAFSTQAVFAADTVTIKADDVSAKAGATFTMNVELSGVPAAGISVCEFAVTYDSSLVTITGVEVGAIADNGVDSAEQFEGVTAFESDFATAGVINVTYSTGMDDTAYWITEDGVFMTITGTVNASAEVGATTDFVLGAIQRETTEGSGVTNTEISVGNIDADYNVTKFTAATENGSLTVVGDETDPTDPAGDVVYGDVDCNGKVEILDVIALSKSLMGSGTLSTQGAANADVDQNATINTTDALNIMKYLVKLIENLPV